jgi:hypothetical protein
VSARETVALAVGVEDAERETAHQRSLLLTPLTAADRAEEIPDLAGDSRAPRPAALHQSSHCRLADPHPLGGLRAREPL